MRYALFLGCTIPARARNYEMSAIEVAKALGIEFVYIDGFSCCGFPLKSYNQFTATILAARNIALAREKALNICTLCSACTSMLKEESHRLDHDEEIRKEVNQALLKVEKEYVSGTKTQHFAKVLLEHSILEKIISSIRVDLKQIPVAIHYGCHYLKPSYVFEDKEDPQSLDLLVRLVGADPIHYKGKKDCCGGAVLAFHEGTSLSLAYQKLKNVKEAGAKAIVVVCPFCSVMYDDSQRTIERAFQQEIGIPVIFLPQLVGLALGIDPKALGLNLNTVKTKSLLEDVLGK